MEELTSMLVFVLQDLYISKMPCGTLITIQIALIYNGRKKICHINLDLFESTLCVYDRDKWVTFEEYIKLNVCWDFLKNKVVVYATDNDMAYVNFTPGYNKMTKELITEYVFYHEEISALISVFLL